MNRLALAALLLLGSVPAVAQPADPAGQSLQAAPLGPRPPAGGPTRFTSLPPAATGVAFESRFEWDHPRRHLYQHGYAGGGVCVGDFDNDGLADLYLVSQTGRDRLYRQTGDLAFEDATDAAGLGERQAWGTGASFADIDNDGDLDLYVCNLDAPNWLFINQGDATFTEEAAARGVGFAGASVMAAFADYDLDGNTDLYLLTNRLYPGPIDDSPQLTRVGGQTGLRPGMEELFAMQERHINGETQKFVIKAGQPDHLYRNNGDGSFTDASSRAGISGNHPGLSATWWDANADGLPDIYICNDFWDPDRLYQNNGDGSFTDVLADRLPHTPWFSMGADFADINNDGLLDLLAADMAPTTHFMSKLMMGDMGDSRWFLESAEPRQYMRNALYLNTGTERFMEVGFLAHAASTDWTWSVKFGDLDNDGLEDLFVTNGTANHSFDPDLTRRLQAVEDRYFAAGGQIDRAALLAEQWALYREVPPRRERNIALRNQGDLDFHSEGQAWGLDAESISFGAALADLDRDGDLDIVVSNIDDPASILRNDSDQGHAVVIRLVGATANRFGLGATVTAETADSTQTRFLSLARGYMSANEPLIHFGLGEADIIDRLTIAWPGGGEQAFEHLPADRFYTITQAATQATTPSDSATPPPPPTTRYDEVAADLGLAEPAGRETLFDDYAREPLLPARLSQFGPGLAWGDADHDGDEDLFLGGPAGVAGRLLLNNATGPGAPATFTTAPGPWEADRAAEDMAPLWLDADSDGDLDLYVASGGVECEPGDPVLRDRLYVNRGDGQFTNAPPTALPSLRESSSTVAAADFDQDGDLDLFVGSRSIPGSYPLTPRSHLLENRGGMFIDITDRAAPGLMSVGLVTSALWSDADRDGQIDLLVACEWGPVSLWRNTGAGLENITEAAGLADRTGWWNALTGADLDGDGDIDYAVTNAGLNTKYKASAEKPAYLYYGSFADGSPPQLVEAKGSADALLPVRGLSASAAAMPFIRDKLPTYHDFASASLTEIYEPDRLDQAVQLHATTLESGVFFNRTDQTGSVRFEFVPLPRLAPASAGYGIVATDTDADGATDLYLVQNCFTREPETGRWDGGLSLLLQGDGSGNLTPVWPAESGLIVPGDAKALTLCDLNADGRPDFLATQNDDRQLAFLARASGSARGVAVRLTGSPGNASGIGALVTLRRSDGQTQTYEVYAGSGYLSQSSPTLYFGLGADPDPATIEVRWPSGAVSTHEVAADAGSVTLQHP